MSRLVFGFLLLVGVVAAGWFAYERLQNRPNQTRRSTGDRRTGRGKQIQPVVRDDGFLGTDKCLECHPEKKSSYFETGHARTFAWAKDVPFLDQLLTDGFYDEQRKRRFSYSLKNNQLFATQDSPGKAELPLQMALGSGDHAVTFLTLMNDKTRNKVGIEHRVSWYHHSGSFGLTPGHELLAPAGSAVEELGKLEEGEGLQKCIDCHTTAAEIDGTRLRKLLPNVGCESCHGKGAKHLAAVDAESDNLEIAFASETWSASAELETCAKCHRAAHQMPEERISPDSETLPRFQPVGLVQSACFKGSEQLACSTCHDPHEHASNRSRKQYLQSCTACHDQADTETLCPVSPTPIAGKDDCIDCHMPPVEVQEGIFFHDHWIRIRNNTVKKSHDDALKSLPARDQQ